MASNILVSSARYLKNVNSSLICNTVKTMIASAPSTKLTRTPQRLFSDEATPEAVTDEQPSIPKGEEEFAEYMNCYKANEYYAHDEYSFYEIENDILKDRLPQPDAT